MYSGLTFKKDSLLRPVFVGHVILMELHCIMKGKFNKWETVVLLDQWYVTGGFIS